jgi:hypothetical protein
MSTTTGSSAAPSKATKYLIFNTAGTVTGVGYTPDGTVPAGRIACTAAQAAAWQGSTVVNGAIIAAPPPPPPTLAQQAQAALAAGVALVSTSTAALDGTYAIDSESRSDMMAEMIALMANGTFTNGTTTLAYADAGGTMHSFPVTQFKAFATGVGGLVGALKAIIKTNTGPLPATTLTIA